MHSNTDITHYANGIYTHKEVLRASRGQILDRNGVVIAQDVVSYTLIAVLSDTRVFGDGRPGYVVDKEATAAALSPMLGMSESAITEYLQRQVYQTQFGTRGRGLSLSVRQRIEALELPGLLFEETVIRNYPLGVFSSHLIGFSQYEDSIAGLVGKMGIESAFNDYLIGINGYKEYQSDISGYIYRDMYQYEEPAVHGNHVTLTIDRGIQESLEMAFEMSASINGAVQSFGSVMEISTGKILAWGQSPSFDPNQMNISDYTNIGAQMAFEPGSTMKTFTYAAAIDTGVYDGQALSNGNFFRMGIKDGLPVMVSEPSQTFSIIRNANRREYGLVSYDESFMRSLNTAIAELLSSRLKPSVFESYLDRFGFFKPVSTDKILETSGNKVFRYPIEMVTTGYGQGSTVTMLQMLQAHSAIFSDGTMVKPYVVEQITDPVSKQVLYQANTTVISNPIKPSTAFAMQDLMIRTVSDQIGTARFYQIPEVAIMAKTGTAQLAEEGGYSSTMNLHSISAAMPADNPKYMVFYAFVSPVSNRAHVDTDATKSLFRKVAMTFNLSDEDRDPISEKEVTIVTLPSFINRPVSDVLTFSNAHATQSVVIGSGLTVIDQYPESKISVLSTQRLFVRTEGKQRVMNDLSGYSRKDVLVYAQLAGIDVQIEGEGYVIAQSIAPETIVGDDDHLVVRLSLNP